MFSGGEARFFAPGEAGLKEAAKAGVTLAQASGMTGFAATFLPMQREALPGVARRRRQGTEPLQPGAW